jgi:hypothetical protein
MNPPTEKNSLMALLAALAISLSANARAEPLSNQKVNDLADRARKTIETFLSESIDLRIRYYYFERFTDPNHRQSLRTLAQNAQIRLRQIETTLSQSAKQIEDYRGDDWEAKFGATGLWQNVSTALARTTIARLDADFYNALTFNGPEQQQKLTEILAELNSLPFSASYTELQKARTLALLSKHDSTYRQSTEKIFADLSTRTDIAESTATQIAVENTLFMGLDSLRPLESLFITVYLGDAREDLEFVLSLSIIMKRHAKDGLEKISATWPRVRTTLGSLILEDLTMRFADGVDPNDLKGFTGIEADLAADACPHAPTAAQKDAVLTLAETDRYNRPKVLYVAARLRLSDDPSRAVDDLITASRADPDRRSVLLEPEPNEIAFEAARLALAMADRDTQYLPTAATAFDNYTGLASGDPNELLMYKYSLLLTTADRQEEAKQILTQLKQHDNKYGIAAEYTLISQELRSENATFEKKQQLLNRLRQLADKSRAQGHTDLWPEIIADYCEFRLASDSPEYAAEVLSLLSRTHNDSALIRCRANALRLLDRIPDALAELSSYDPNNPQRKCVIAAEGFLCLDRFMQRIDEHRHDPAFEKMVADAMQAARLCLDCLKGDSRSRAVLYLAELYTFTADRQNLTRATNLLKADFTPEDVHFLRCRARLAQAQGDFEQAARLWAQTAQVSKTRPPTAEWWRARYYELRCLARTTDFDKAKIAHAIDVLENTYDNIPAFWMHKLAELKDNL